MNVGAQNCAIKKFKSTLYKINFSTKLCRNINLLFFTVGVLFFVVPLSAQQANSTTAGSVIGYVSDSTYGFMLTSATIAVYKQVDSSLIEYSLPNALGAFSLKSLPLQVPLQVILSHIGYRSVTKNLILTKEHSTLNYGRIYMRQVSDGDTSIIKEVVVSAIAPIRMNHDTLEFNANAFKLDSNATTEDLLRRLPGFTIWGDGDITFNGKKINQILVEGKPFMGTGDNSIATQNLPKSIVDKIQVYQRVNEKNPLDSAMFANIKLKDQKKFGYFGKVGGGYGTQQKYTVDGMLGGFNKKTQVNVVGAFNNINKIANTNDILIRNNSFKANGTNIEYQSDFNMRGINKPLASGIKLQHNFDTEAENQESNLMNLDLFILQNDMSLLENTEIKTFLNNDSILSKKILNSDNNRTTNKTIDFSYEKTNRHTNLKIKSFFIQNSILNKNNSIVEQDKTGFGPVSKGVTTNISRSVRKKNISEINFTKTEDANETNRIPGEFSFRYVFSIDDVDENSRIQASFLSVYNPLENRVFDRLYEKDNIFNTTHKIYLSYPQIRKLIFNKRRFGDIDMSLSANYSISINTNLDKVLDIDIFTHTYILNTYLTHNRNEQMTDFSPAFNLSKSFRKNLTNRFNKWTTINVHLQNQYFKSESYSTNIFQNYFLNYTNFLPYALIEHYNHQYGSYETKYSLNFLTAVTYPNINNIAPLIDSTKLYYIYKGNPKITPEYKKEISFDYSFTTRKSKNPFQLHTKASIVQIDNSITDSTLYDESGVRTSYSVNVDKDKYRMVALNVKKSIEFKKKSIQFEIKYTFNNRSTPHYLNGRLNRTNNSSHDIISSLILRSGERSTIITEYGSFFSTTNQTNSIIEDFVSINKYFRLISALQFPKKMLWSTNITYNRSSNSNSKRNNFTIWNLSYAYRFLKGNQGEAKISLLDILHQNKGIVNVATANSQTYTTSNVLQNYCLFTLSYYPRKFGK